MKIPIFGHFSVSSTELTTNEVSAYHLVALISLTTTSPEVFDKVLIVPPSAINSFSKSSLVSTLEYPASK